MKANININLNTATTAHAHAHDMLYEHRLARNIPVCMTQHADEYPDTMNEYPDTMNELRNHRTYCSTTSRKGKERCKWR
jgi:hypothetical protein